MSNTDNQTLNIPASSIPYGSLQFLRLHCQLTNQPVPQYKIFPSIQPNNPTVNPPSSVNINIVPDSERNKRALTQNFYLVDSPINSIQYPTIHLVGNQALLYTVKFTSLGITCTCPDDDPVCKHIRFILFISGVTTSGQKFLTFPLQHIIKSLHDADISQHKLDHTTSSICMATLSMKCNICNKCIKEDYLMCDKCLHIFHSSCTKHNQRHHHINTCNPVSSMKCAKRKLKRRHPQTSTSAQICHSCNKPWTPMNILVQTTTNNTYNNLRGILKPKGYVFGNLRKNTKPIRNLRTHAKNSSSTGTKRFRKLPSRKLVFPSPTNSKLNISPSKSNDKKDDNVYQYV